MKALPEASERRVCRVLEVSRSSVRLNKSERDVRRRPFIDEELAKKRFTGSLGCIPPMATGVYGPCYAMD